MSITANKSARLIQIGYLLELNSPSFGDQKVFVAVDAFTDDASKIGIPTATSGTNFQQAVKAMEVFSNVSTLTKGLRIEGGHLEFWPNNYGPGNGTEFLAHRAACSTLVMIRRRRPMDTGPCRFTIRAQRRRSSPSTTGVRVREPTSESATAAVKIGIGPLAATPAAIREKDCESMSDPSNRVSASPDFSDGTSSTERDARSTMEGRGSNRN